MKARPWLRLVCAVLVAALLAAACGGDRDDDPSATDDTSTTEPEGDDGEGTDGFGDLESPCGEGDAAGATEQGVTDDAITIGYGDDAGFATSPGLNHEMTDAVEALIEWCNEQGGINGREVKGTYFDAKIFEVNNVMLQACDSVFMLVGQGWALDSAQEETRVGCGLPAVPAYSVSPEFAMGPMVVQPVPNPIDFMTTDMAATIAEEFPEEIKKTAVMFANFAATIDTKDKVLATYPEHGFEFLDCPQLYNVSGEADWRPIAQALKDCGAEIVYFSGAPFPNFQNYLEAAAQIEFDPIYMLESNFYVSGFAEWNTQGLADDAYIRSAFVPLEEADENPATQQYIDLVEGNGGDISQLGEQAASAFLLWATAVKECGAELTRECVLDELEKIDSWTGGGLHSETDPAGNMPPECAMVLTMEGTEFVRHNPEDAASFDCSPDHVTPVTGPVVDRAELGPDRVSTKFTG